VAGTVSSAEDQIGLWHAPEGNFIVRGAEETLLVALKGVGGSQLLDESPRLYLLLLTATGERGEIGADRI
jgi:hypothetical protein